MAGEIVCGIDLVLPFADDASAADEQGPKGSLPRAAADFASAIARRMKNSSSSRPFSRFSILLSFQGRRT